eukprot:TRINITY_DN7044_c0_g1_i4.p1 TRINITY_DN7044_c0_g1~~TRINITY_DN7044_c0_g1_i4.p1  ORF type:complete len:153 (-),score=29.61 TRINITY_DN7044_c0_g1_i4:263-721(-)
MYVHYIFSLIRYNIFCLMGSNCFQRKETLTIPEEEETEEDSGEMSKRIAEEGYRVKGKNETALVDSFIMASMKMKADVKRASQTEDLPVMTSYKKLSFNQLPKNQPQSTKKLIPALLQRSISMKFDTIKEEKAASPRKLKRNKSRVIHTIYV